MIVPTIVIMPTDIASATTQSPLPGSQGGSPTRYNPRLLGGGSMVPYIGSWTGEELCATRVVYRSGGGIGFADETVLDRDRWGVLWTRMTGRIGVGKPLFTKLHPVRQRRAMSRLLCQVCARPADYPDRGQLWLVPEKGIRAGEDWFEGMSTIHPPLCRECAKISVRMCPALRPRFVALHAQSRICGVAGLVFGPGRPVPSPIDSGDDEVIQLGDPTILGAGNSSGTHPV